MAVGLKFPKGTAKKKEDPIPQVFWEVERADVICAENMDQQKSIISLEDPTGHYQKIMD